MKHVLDARNLICPMPVIRTQDTVANLEDADELEVLFTDPGGLHDVPAWCRVHGHEVLEQVVEPEFMRLRVRVHKG